MKCWDEYIAYIKDNPKGYWFKRKLYGYGWTPAKPEGWAVVFSFILLVLGLVLFLEKTGGVDEQPGKFAAVMAAAVALLLAISWKTGEPLRWQWGPKRDKSK